MRERNCDDEEEMILREILCEAKNVFDKGDAWMVALLEDLWILLREGEERKNLVHMKQLKRGCFLFYFSFLLFWFEISNT